MKVKFKPFKILSGIILAGAVLAAAACACSIRPTEGGEHPTETQEIEVGDTSFTEYEFTQQTPVDGIVTYERLNMTNDYTKRHGIYGDGCQWEVAFECSKTGDLMLYGIDVAGMYRSLDHGKTWETCNNGILNRGVGMFSIDPVNSKHVLAAGLGNRNTDGYGMWRSDDMCETWNATAKLCIGGERYIWDGLEFDSTSSNGNICTDVYYSAPYMRDRNLRMNAYDLPSLYGQMDKAQAGLYKSVDGGNVFTQISADERLSDGILKITDSGRIFIGNQHGLFEADENGKIVATLFENVITDFNETVTRQIRGTDETCQILKCNMGVAGLDCVGNFLYAQTWDAIYKIDTDKGLSYENITEGGNYPDVWAQMITVSPKENRYVRYFNEIDLFVARKWGKDTFIAPLVAYFVGIDKAVKVEADTTSGDVTLSDCAVTDLLNFDTVSGKLKARLSQPLNTFEGNSTSGTINVNAPSLSRFEAETVSGEVSLSAQTEPARLEVETTSGNINLNLPENASFTLDYDATSGDLSSDLLHKKSADKYVFGAGTGAYTIDCISGDVHITAIAK